MNKIEHLTKLLMLHDKKEQNLILKAIACKKYLDEELRKLNLLESCLQEYKLKLKSTKNGLTSFTYQQYYAFFNQLDKAIIQQKDSVARSREVHLKWLKEIEAVRKKREGLKKLITKEKTLQQIKMDKRENQLATDIFNQLKPRT